MSLLGNLKLNTSVDTLASLVLLLVAMQQYLQLFAVNA
jgi:hypothetical protein